MSTTKYLGIDLGTSNSAVSFFEDGQVQPILNPRGEVNNPSVVRVTPTGIVVGDKAKKHLYVDSSNTFKEFKRLLGTQTLSQPDRNGHQWRAEELSSEVLKHLKKLATDQLDAELNKAVITVPALFEIPQSKATSEAARMAGFEQVELLPEPVASGLAAGWTSDQAGKAWLVYDLGGGTFDVSLLEARDGLLRVVGHDGDNFLGGRDIDRKIVEWILEQLEASYRFKLDVADPEFTKIKRHLESAAELTKIRLSLTETSVIELEFEYQDEDFEFDLPFTRAQLTKLCEPLIQRSIAICIRLLKNQGLALDKLARVVLVGGPAHMPMIQEMVAEQLAPIAEGNGDPMALVAKGAAIYAATINLGCDAVATAEEASPQKIQVWLQYPSVCTELNPTIMGRIVDDELSLAFVKVNNADKAYETDFIAVDSNKMFMAEVAITSGSKNTFELSGFDQHKNPLNLHHQTIHIVHGLTMSDPPLSRSIGVALADGSVKAFIDRGTPLPAKRTFVQSVVDTLQPGSDHKLSIPIVQGERRQSRFCRKVGSLEINAKDLKQSLSVGAPIEITLEIDRGGDLKAHALIAEQGLVIEGVAKLVMDTTSPNVLRTSIHSLNRRLTQRLQQAFGEREDQLVVQLHPLAEQIQVLLSELPLLDSDTDACHRLSRSAMEIEAELELIESQDELLELIEEIEILYYRTAGNVSEWGNDVDKGILEECSKQMATAFQNKRQGELERLFERLEQLNHSACQKSPTFWGDIFQHWASFAHASTNPKRTEEIIKQGRAEMAKGEYKNMRQLTNELYSYIPQQYKNQGSAGSYESGIY